MVSVNILDEDVYTGDSALVPPILSDLVDPLHFIQEDNPSLLRFLQRCAATPDPPAGEEET